MSAIRLSEHYEDLEKQGHAARLGMWVFLTSEVMLFAALFAVYGFYRAAYPGEFDAAAQHADLLLGSVNTLVLITSSFVVAMSLHAVRRRRPGLAALLLCAAAGLGACFLGVKAIEYADHLRHGIAPGAGYHFAGAATRGAALFFTLYYVMTGLHAAHVLVGIVVLLWLAARARRGAFGPGRREHVALEMGTLYWHLVDVIWIFLWPLFYLVR